MSSTDAIIDELLQLDPSLSNKREELVQIVEQLLAAQPNMQATAEFKQQLLQDLHRKMPEADAAPSYFFSFLSFMDNKFLFAGAGAVVGAFAVLVWPHVTQTTLQPMEEADDVYNRSAITSLQPQGFGSLAAPNMQMARGQGGGGGGGGAGMPMMEGGTEEKMMATDGMILPPYDYYRTEYKYEGDIALPTADVQVYMRTKPSSKPSGSSVTKGFAQNMLDWSKLGGVQVTNINLQQPGSAGFSVNIDYNEGTINMYRNITAAERPDMYCNEPDCYEKNRLRESDMLPDDRLITIAKNFAQEYGLDVSNYGEPIVNNDWRTWYELSTDTSDFYFPDQATVVFPLLIDGKPVYEEYGMPFGMQVSVDIRLKKVTNMYNYYLSTYEQSAYAPLSDAEKAKEAVKRGSLYSWYDENAKVANATLGEPIEGYMTYYRWDQDTQTSKNLLLPALIFPVVDRDKNVAEYKNNVVIPLVAEVYEEQQMYPEPRPMPVEPLEAPATEPTEIQEDTSN